MAKFADCNNVAVGSGNYNVNNAYLTHQLSVLKKSAGWTVPKSSDGITYNAAADQISLATNGVANGWGTSSWKVHREPGGRREWCLQFANAAGSTTSQWRIKYSASSRFTGGTPGATRVPSAADEQLLLGGGTDAAPTYAPLYNIGAGNVRYHIVADSTPINGCYPFCLYLLNVGGANQTSGVIGQEPMAVGSNSAADADPCVIYASGTASGPGASGSFCWFDYGSGAQVWVPGPTLNPGLFAGSLGVDLGNSYDINGYPIYSASVSSAVRIKGAGTTIASKGPARTYPAYCNSASDAKAYLGSLVWPFANNLVPSIA